MKVTTFALVAILAAAVWLAWATSPDPRFNPASFEPEPLTMEIATPDVATTLAQHRSGDGRIATLLVESYDSDFAVGVDLAALGAPLTDDPFAALAGVPPKYRRIALPTSLPRTRIAISDLLPAGPSGERHLGTGTNFPEHAEEADSGSVFMFPKFGTATPARTQVTAPPGSLLDYEVELCMRFDRPIASTIDFDNAVKGVFLCSDFTDRIALLELADPDNLDSGYGFSDAKSGPGFFPTGPFLVIPQDWKTFVAETRMMTHMNGEPRQDARGAEMIHDFRALAERALSDMQESRFYYQGEFFKLAPAAQIALDMTLMSGTSEGVIFTLPQRHDYIEIAIGYVLEGDWLSGQGLMEFAIPAFVRNEQASKHFLQPGDTVRYVTNYLGDIEVRVTH